jgi:hypothetical protein
LDWGVALFLSTILLILNAYIIFFLCKNFIGFVFYKKELEREEIGMSILALIGCFIVFFCQLLFKIIY